MKTSTLKTLLFLNPIFWITILAVILAVDSCYPQNTSGDYDVIVGGHPDEFIHDMIVKQSFIDGYESFDNTPYVGVIDYIPKIHTYLFQYAQDNGYEMAIYSYGGANYYSTLADNYPDVLIVMPAGSNSFELKFYQDIETCPMVITGAGADTNITGYTTEFHSIDPTGDNLSSFANGYIAGQIAFIANSLQISFQEARMLARETGSRNGIYDYYSGYGLINIESALPVELVAFTGKIINNTVTLTWETATELNNYGFEIERNYTGIWDSVGFVEGHGNSNSPKYYTFEDNDLNNGKYLYRLKQIDNDGTFEYSESIEINNTFVNSYVLQQNYPNPFNPTTTIEYSIPEAGNVKLIVYDVLGNEVDTLVNGYVTSNNNKVLFDATNLASGTYIYNLTVNGNSINKKMVVLK